jgi:predicted nucleotidyltransferase
LTETIQQLLRELKDQLTRLYGDRLKGVYLFGSYARDEQDEESDLDILVVLDHLDNYSREIAHTSAVISELSLRYGITLSRVFASEKQWREDSTMFFLNVREETIPA